MLRANLFQFTFSEMNIQCLTDWIIWAVRILIYSFLHFTSTKKLKHVFGFLPVTMCRSLRPNMSFMKVLQWISSLYQVSSVCCDVTLLYQGWLLPSCKLRYDYQLQRFRIHKSNSSPSETLGADDMWHAIVQIIKVNVTHFLSYERQILSHSPNQLRHSHSITSRVCVSKDLLWRADGMTTVSLHRFGNFKKGEKINRERHFREPDMAVGFKWVIGLTLEDQT